MAGLQWPPLLAQDPDWRLTQRHRRPMPSPSGPPRLRPTARNPPPSTPGSTVSPTCSPFTARAMPPHSLSRPMLPMPPGAAPFWPPRCAPAHSWQPGHRHVRSFAFRDRSCRYARYLYRSGHQSDRRHSGEVVVNGIRPRTNNFVSDGSDNN